MNSERWGELFSEHLRVLNYSERTVYSYSLEVRLFCEFLSARDVYVPTEIQRDDVTAYQLLLHGSRKKDGKPLAASTRCCKIGAVLSFLKFLHEKSFVLADPGRDVKRPRVPDSLPPEVPDEDQVLKLLEQPDTSQPEGLRDRALLEVLYATAVRNSELRALRVEDVDLHRLELTVCLGKGGWGRKVPLSEHTGMWLEAYLVEARPVLQRDIYVDALFLNRWGRPLQKDSVCKFVRRHAEAAEMPLKITPHVLRHACATHMLARRAGLRHLQRFLGHASSSSTERYTRVEVSDLREVMLRCHPREGS